MEDFQEMIDRHRARMESLAEILQRDGRIIGTSLTRDGNQLLLTRSCEKVGGWRVTTFWYGVPTSHREYDHLNREANPINSAFAEFASADWALPT